MVDIRLMQKILQTPKEEIIKLLKDNPVYQKFLFFKETKKQRRLINRSLEEKLKASGIDNNLEAYLGIKNDINNILNLADSYLGKMKKQQYLQAMQHALQEKDPAECFGMLARICEKIREEVLFVAGQELTGESAKDEPLDIQISTYVNAAMKYMEELKKK